MPGSERTPCPDCGEKNFKQDPVCLRCGRALYQRPAKHGPAAEAHGAPPARGVMAPARVPVSVRYLLLFAVFSVLGLGVALLFKPPQVGGGEWLSGHRGAVLLGALAACRLVHWFLAPPHWRDLEDRPSDRDGGGGF